MKNINKSSTGMVVGSLVFSALFILSVVPAQAQPTQPHVRDEKRVNPSVESGVSSHNKAMNEGNVQSNKPYANTQTNINRDSNVSMNAEYTFNEKDQFVTDVESELESIEKTTRISQNTPQHRQLKEEMASIKQDIKNKLQSINAVDRSEFETAKREIQQHLRKLRSVQEKSVTQ